MSPSCIETETGYWLQIGTLQIKLRESQTSSHDHHDMLKAELTRRDDTIQALRHDVLRLQEKRDAYQAEVSNRAT